MDYLVNEDKIYSDSGQLFFVVLHPQNLTAAKRDELNLNLAKKEQFCHNKREEKVTI
jgi:hypothetical protein